MGGREETEVENSISTQCDHSVLSGRVLMGWGDGRNDTSNRSRNPVLLLIPSAFRIREENKKREREKEEECLKLEEKGQE